MPSSLSLKPHLSFFLFSYLPCFYFFFSFHLMLISFFSLNISFACFLFLPPTYFTTCLSSFSSPLLHSFSLFLLISFHFLSHYTWLLFILLIFSCTLYFFPLTISSSFFLSIPSLSLLFYLYSSSSSFTFSPLSLSLSVCQLPTSSFTYSPSPAI